MALRVGINGFGRFGLHLLKYWLDRDEKSHFNIFYINDDYLDKAYDLIINKSCLNAVVNSQRQKTVQSILKKRPKPY